MTGYPFPFYYETYVLTGNPFPSDFAAYAFATGFLVWVVSEVIGETVIPSMKRRGARVQPRSRGSGALIYVAWVFVLGISMGN